MTSLLDRDVPGQDGDGDGAGADAFAVLGLRYSPDLTDADVRAAYLQRLKATHPDSGGDTAAAAAVTAAYDALRSAVRRGELLAAATIDRDSAPASDPGRAGRRRTGRAARPSIGAGRVPDAARRAELRAKVAASRAAQGLPPYITDEATLSKIADLLAVSLGREPVTGPPRSLSAAWPWDGAGREPPPSPRGPSSWRRDRKRWRVLQRDRLDSGVVYGPAWRIAWARIRHGRPAWLTGRIILAAIVTLVAQDAAPGSPAVPALAVGALTWAVLTARFDLLPRPWQLPRRRRRRRRRA